MELQHLQINIHKSNIEENHKYYHYTKYHSWAGEHSVTSDSSTAATCSAVGLSNTQLERTMTGEGFFC